MPSALGRGDLHALKAAPAFPGDTLTPLDAG